MGADQRPLSIEVRAASPSDKHLGDRERKMSTTASVGHVPRVKHFRVFVQGSSDSVSSSGEGTCDCAEPSAAVEGEIGFQSDIEGRTGELHGIPWTGRATSWHRINRGPDVMGHGDEEGDPDADRSMCQSWSQTKPTRLALAAKVALRALGPTLRDCPLSYTNYGNYQAGSGGGRRDFGPCLARALAPSRCDKLTS